MTNPVEQKNISSKFVVTNNSLLTSFVNVSLVKISTLFSRCGELGLKKIVLFAGLFEADIPKLGPGKSKLNRGVGYFIPEAMSLNARPSNVNAGDKPPVRHHDYN